MILSHLFLVLLFLVLFALSYALLWGVRLVPRLVVSFHPWRFAALAVLLLCCAVSAGCAELAGGAGSSVCANTTPHTPSAATTAGVIINCADPALAQLAQQLLGQVADKLEGGSPDFLADLTGLETSGPGAVACAGQGLLSAACAPAATAPASTAPTASTTTPATLTSGPGNLARPVGTAAASVASTPSKKLSPVAIQRAQKYLHSVAARGFRFKS